MKLRRQEWTGDARDYSIKEAVEYTIDRDMASLQDAFAALVEALVLNNQLSEQQLEEVLAFNFVVDFKD